ncbi:hypothetical protein NGRA_2868 [Nosema granulosis]|uniref:Uncharacterized protein n=1 Tax=Nosema granulosis TaxID=83296 RepID=A0A9P6GVU5_9MICR|nr:hypothetical protein NGRA_2868 [Nosema granulosis]
MEVVRADPLIEKMQQIRETAPIAAEAMLTAENQAVVFQMIDEVISYQGYDVLGHDQHQTDRPKIAGQLLVIFLEDYSDISISPVFRKLANRHRQIENGSMGGH